MYIIISLDRWILWGASIHQLIKVKTGKKILKQFLIFWPGKSRGVVMSFKCQTFQNAFINWKFFDFDIYQNAKMSFKQKGK